MHEEVKFESDENNKPQQSIDAMNESVYDCEGEPVPNFYEDRLGVIMRRHAGYLPNFSNL